MSDIVGVDFGDSGSQTKEIHGLRPPPDLDASQGRDLHTEVAVDLGQRLLAHDERAGGRHLLKSGSHVDGVADRRVLLATRRTDRTDNGLSGMNPYAYCQRFPFGN